MPNLLGAVIAGQSFFNCHDDLSDLFLRLGDKKPIHQAKSCAAPRYFAPTNPETRSGPCHKPHGYAPANWRRGGRFVVPVPMGRMVLQSVPGLVPDYKQACRLFVCSAQRAAKQDCPWVKSFLISQ
jgi:hypothetical protein